MIAAPPAIAWAVASGSGSIDTTGIYTAALPAGPASVSATCGAAVGTASLRVNAAPTVAAVVSTSTPIISGITAEFTVRGADDDRDQRRFLYYLSNVYAELN